MTMNNHEFFITTDSGCDLQLPYCEERGIVPLFMTYTMNGRSYHDIMTEQSCKDFYNEMRNGGAPATSQVNPSEYLDFWSPMLEAGKPILHIALGGGISGTYSNALVARDMLKVDYPDSVIHVVNSTQASAGYGLMCMIAADMRDKGCSPEEIVEWLNDNKRSVNAYYTTPDLHYLQRGGRVSKTSAVLGGLLNINPILDLDAEGHLKVAEKVRGASATLDRMFKIIKERVIDPQNQTIVISHADAYDKANEFGKRLVNDIGFKDVFITYIGSTIGTHTGPGLISVFFIGANRAYARNSPMNSAPEAINANRA